MKLTDDVFEKSMESVILDEIASGWRRNVYISSMVERVCRCFVDRIFYSIHYSNPADYNKGIQGKISILPSGV